MNSKVLYPRTVGAWQLTFSHAGQMLHFLTRALLLSMASIAMGFAWLCCWLDRFRSDKGTAWIIPVKTASPSASVRLEPVAVPGRRQPRASARMPHHPRTIDSMIRSKGLQI